MGPAEKQPQKLGLLKNVCKNAWRVEFYLTKTYPATMA